MRTGTWLTALLVMALPLSACSCGDDTVTGGGGSGGIAGAGGSGATGGVGNNGGMGGSVGGQGGTGGQPAVANDTCANPDKLTIGLGESASASGTTTGAQDDTKSFCIEDANDVRNDVFYELTLEADCTLDIQVDGTAPLDPAISLRSACDVDEYCVNSTGNTEVFRRHATAGTYFIVVSDMDNSGGDFQLTVECTPPTCGDGVLNPTEDCDDGGTQPGDGCDAQCHFEATDPTIDTCVGATASAGTTLALNSTVFIPPTGTRTTLGASDSGTGISYLADPPGCMYEPDGTTSFPSPDHVYKVTPTANGTLTVTLGADQNGVPFCGADTSQPPVQPYPAGCWDRSIHVRAATCDQQSAEVGCSDSAFNWWDVETATIPVTAGTSYYVFVDGWLDVGDGTDRGAYVLKLNLAP
ncbi:MAG: hypothetical protein U0271_42420 [Polyangiaceae bacterium]